MGRVLVITPTYERPVMCARAVDSLLAQDFAAWDLLIVKNGTRVAHDDYIEALGRRLGHPRIQMVSLRQAGLALALNHGIQTSLEGHSHFAILEDDDEWDSEFLRRMYNASRDAQADVVHCMQRQVPHQLQGPGRPLNPALLLKVNYINFPMCLFRAPLAPRVGRFSAEAGPACDWDWHLRCVQAGAKYAFVPIPLVTHHWHGGNYCRQEPESAYVLQRIAQGAYS